MIFVKNPTMYSVKKVAPIKNIILAPKLTLIANPRVFLIFATSCIPQNCDMKVAEPLTNPNITIQKIKKGWTPTPTAESSVSPSLPTIILSTRLSDEPIRLCSAMGSATLMSVL